MENNTTQKKGGSRLLIVLLIISLIGNIWQWSGRNNMEDSYTQQMDSLITERVDVEKELNDTYSELNQYKGINSRLDSLLLEANGKIDEQKNQIQKLKSNEKNSAALNKKLQAQVKELQALRDQYLEKIDQLLIENAQLKKDKEDMTTTIETLNKNLESTVSTASELKAEYMVPKAYKKRSNDKYTETLMARRTNKLEMCYSLLGNKIAKPGSRTAYLRVIEPGGNVLGSRAEGSSTFRKAGTTEDLLYTTSKTFDYTNEKTDLCMNWEEAERVFVSGTYLMEVYVDGILSGTTQIKLQ